MKAFFLFIIVLLIIGGGLRLAGASLPLIDNVLGGPMAQPIIHINQAPDLGIH